MTDWDMFLAAQVGASAALAGLLFVGISINMTKILAVKSLPNMAMRALILLIAILIVASVLLVPDQLLQWQGVELVAVGGAVFALTSWASIASLRLSASEYRTGAVFMTATVMGTTVLYPLAGVVILVAGAVGINVVVPAMLLSFVIAIFDSWVLLVEINR